ncbi:MAG: phenylalanyl-tRNA synthetase alpha subunit [Microbacterium sp.]|nr:phenylalanyl-tRNA synthetase alpha subunit [Microbacterium sp.]
MRRRAALTICAGLVLVTVSAGCSGRVDLVDEEMSLDDAKRLAQNMEREIVQSLPPGLVTAIEQQEKGALLACSRDGARQWAGGLTATVVGDPVPEDVIGAIADRFVVREDFRVSLREDQGDSLVTISGEDQSVWVVRYIRSRAELDIDSGSPCIRLPDDVWPGGSY